MPDIDEPFSPDGLPDFWNQVKAASKRLLMLDYDGTLAPFRTRRMQAVPAAGVLEHLQAIASSSGAELAIISGRPISEILSLIGNLGVTIVGSHGWEILHANGHRESTPMKKEQTHALRDAKQAISDRKLRRLLESKTASIAFHSRSLDTSEEGPAQDYIEDLWRPIAESADLQCRRFNGGVELRATGRDKGKAVLDLTNEQPTGRLSVYLGDDDTDEDAFKALAGFGIAIKVGAGSTAAPGRLPDIESVVRFLADWRKVTVLRTN